MADITVKLPNLANQTAIVNALNKIAQQTLDVRSLVSQAVKDNWKTIYPVGSIYVSVNSTSPASLFGGSWEQIKKGVLFSAGHEYKQWTKLCDENESFTLTETSQVRFGRYDTYVYKELSPGTYTANADLFGSDPYPGVLKHVDIYKSFTIDAGATGGEVTHQLSVGEMPFHQHPIMTTNSASWSQPGWSKQTWLAFMQSGYQNKQSTGNNVSPTWTGFRGGSENGTQPHNNMPPYLAVNMWKRVA